MISGHRLWPRYGEQERAFFQCLDVVFKTAIKGQEISGDKILHSIFRKVDSNLSQKRMYRDRPFGTVMAHVTSRLHTYQDDTELCILHNGLGTPARFALPRRASFSFSSSSLMLL